MREYLRHFADSGIGSATPIKVGSMLRDWLRCVGGDVADELIGLAAGSQIAPELIIAIDARTENIATATAASECSTVAEEEGLPAWLVQNWDWYPGFRGSRLLWIARLRGMRWRATFTEVGTLAKIGINSDRVDVGLNLLHSPRGASGVPYRFTCCCARRWIEAERRIRR
ncbi:MAG: hypothetical protein M3406_01260 [Chloroflexota bacterium]|nr:hypothetical protein [Chloroflexota bacterium]